MRSFPFLALSAVHIESSIDVQALCLAFLFRLGILSSSGRSRDAASAGSFLFVGSFFSAVATHSLSCFLFLLFLFFLVTFNAEGLEIEFDLFARDRVRLLFMPPRDRSRDSSIVLDWLLCAFHIDFALTIGLRTPKKLVYHLARLNPTMNALVSTDGDLKRFSATVCKAVFGLLVVVPLKNIDAMCTYACNPDAPRSRRYSKVRCFRGISPMSTDGLSIGDINLYARLLLANVNSLRANSAGVATSPLFGEFCRRY